MAFDEGTKHSARVVAAWTIMLLLLAASRLIYAPPYLFFFDNANFALAIDHFDPRLHQPQPPGYPVFVALIKALNLIVHSANRSLTISGLIGSAAGLVLVWDWACAMFGRRAGWTAAALLFVHPVFWVAGIVNPVRTFLVVIAAATATLSWRVLTEPSPQVWFYAASASLGLLSGFRPECLLLLFPLWFATGWSRRLGFRTLALGTFILVLATAVWLLPLVIRMGGAQATYLGFSDYLRSNSTRDMAAYGAPESASTRTLRLVFVWNFGLTIAWIWAVPFVLSSLRKVWSLAHSFLLGLAFIPPFLFHAMVHSREVDHTLVTIPALCVLGGAVLAALRPRSAMLAAATLAILISIQNFRWPMFRDMSRASRGAVRFINDWNRSTFNALAELKPAEDAILVWDDSVVTWRQVCYYYPRTPLLVLSQAPPLWVDSCQGRAVTVKDGSILVPNSGRLILGVSYAQGEALAGLLSAGRRGPLVVLPWPKGAQAKVGRYLLRSIP